MGLRDRVKKTFKKKEGGSSSGGSTPSTGSDSIHYTGRTDIEYYKPHEIPRSKYRGRVDPEHKEKLDAFSFSDAFGTAQRRASQALSGVMSPGGTKSQSRRPSCISHVSNDGQNHLSRSGTSAGNPPAPLIRENSNDDTDVLNGQSIHVRWVGWNALTGSLAGLSRHGTTKGDRDNIPDVKLERQATVTDQPFTAEDLEQAMTRATLRIESEDTLRISPAIAAH